MRLSFFIGLVIAIIALLIGCLLKDYNITMKNLCKIIVIALLLISCVIFGAYQHFQRSSSFRFTQTTNLSQENIDGLQMYQSIDSEEFVEKYGTNLNRIDNALFDYYKLSDGLIIATNEQRQIIRITINIETNNTIETSKGIELGSSIDEVINTYGTNYYKRTEEQIPSSPVIGYIDHKRKVTIEFWNVKNKVVEIRYDIASME